MNSLQKKVFTRVSGAHAVVLFLLLFIPWVKGCFHRKPKEIITYVSLAGTRPSLPAPVDVVEPAPVPAIPQPAKKLPPPATNSPPKVVKAATKPKPPPPKVPPKKPEATKPAPPPKKTEVIKPKPPPPKKETMEERLAKIRQNNPVAKPTVNPTPSLDYSGLKSALANAASGAGSSSGTGSGSGVYSPFAGYYDSIKRQIYAIWQQPSGVPVGMTATAVLRVERDGRVSVKSISLRSGNASFDQSVQSALTATIRLPVPPADLPSRDIEVEFALSN